MTRDIPIIMPPLRVASGSGGGEAITHRELAKMLPELKEALRLINSLLTRADNMGIAA